LILFIKKTPVKKYLFNRDILVNHSFENWCHSNQYFRATFHIYIKKCHKIQTLCIQDVS